MHKNKEKGKKAALEEEDLLQQLSLTGSLA